MDSLWFNSVSRFAQLIVNNFVLCIEGGLFNAGDVKNDRQVDFGCVSVDLCGLSNKFKFLHNFELREHRKNDFGFGGRHFLALRSIRSSSMTINLKFWASEFFKFVVFARRCVCRDHLAMFFCIP